MKYMLSVFVAIGLSACAGITDVVSIGGGSYMVASHGTMGWSSGPAQLAKAMQDAGKFCGAKGLDLSVISATDTPGGFGKIASGEVKFRCTPITN